VPDALGTPNRSPPVTAESFNPALPIARLHILCGLPCSGKTRLSRELEAAEPALNLCSDTWISRIVTDGYDKRARDEVEAIQLELATRALQLGVNVILQWGFWSRADRQKAVAAATSVGAQAQIHFLDVPLAELLHRLHIRNARLPPHTFHVDPKDLIAWAGDFEPPTDDEPLASRLTRTGAPTSTGDEPHAVAP
jgi:predicted kinase